MFRLKNSLSLSLTFTIVCVIGQTLLTAALAFAQPAEIDALGFEWGENIYDVVIKGKGNLVGTARFIDNPPHIEVEFENTVNRIPQAVEAPENPYVHRVRATKGKIIVELKWKFAFTLQKISDGVVVRLFSRATATPETTQQPATTPVLSAPTPIHSPPPPVSATSQAVIKPAPDPSGDELVIGPEDLVEINVFQLPEFSMTTRVLGDGSITMPLIGTIKIAGLDGRKAEKKIADALAAKHVNNPSVALTIKEYKSRQISVLGAVNREGIYYLTSSRTLLQILSEAGGLKDETAPKCYVFRGGSKIEINLRDLIQNGNESLDVSIMPGDVINVPPRPRGYAYVYGAVRNPGAVEIAPTEGLTLAGAIARAGGPSRLANVSNIQITRKNESGKEQVLKANLKDILKGKTPDIPILPEDLINVPESFF